MYFTDKELQCPHCGKNEMNKEFVYKMNIIRSQLGYPLVVNSAYRCPEHNNRVSSTGAAGPHTTGRAVDLRATSRQRYEILEAAKVLGMTRFGIGKTFIHIDDLSESHGFTGNVIWTY